MAEYLKLIPSIELLLNNKWFETLLDFSAHNPNKNGYVEMDLLSSLYVFFYLSLSLSLSMYNLSISKFKFKYNLTSFLQLWFVIDYFHYFAVCTADNHVQCSKIKYWTLHIFCDLWFFCWQCKKVFANLIRSAVSLRN